MVTATKATGQRGRGSPANEQNVSTPADPGVTPEVESAAGDAASRSVGTRQDAPSTLGHPRAAAEKTTRHNSTQIAMPVLGTVKLPPADELAFLGGVGVLAVVGAIEWPIAAAIGAGHLLASKRRNKVLQEFGEALERV